MEVRRKTIEVLCRETHDDVQVLLNSGNRGDGLIMLGGRQLFRKYQIPYREFHYPTKTSGKILWVYGCGAFSVPYHHMVERVAFYLNRFEQIVILPASFDMACPEVAAFISTLPNRVTVFCRERFSYAQAYELLPHPKRLFLDSDLAFRADLSPWRNDNPSGTLIALNTNAERAPSIDLKSIPGNRDISEGSEREYEGLLAGLKPYRTVLTNRAHVAIPAAMLGKEVLICDSSYHKIRGIYETSLFAFPNVTWLSESQMADRIARLDNPPAGR